ncbi:hypothetical protein RSAG8_11425, partial [Rhizoctonia solani AG-8 WAC10335]
MSNISLESPVFSPPGYHHPLLSEIMRTKKSNLKPPAPLETSYDSTLFASLKVHSDGRQTIMRTRPPGGKTPYEQRRKVSRETEWKKEMDSRRLVLKHVCNAIDNKITLPFRMSHFMQYEQRRKVSRETEWKKEMDSRRLVLKHVCNAIDNKITLPFRMSHFMQDRGKGNIPMDLDHPYGELAKHKTRLKASDRPTLLVDLDDVVLFWYFPGFIGNGTQNLVLSRLAELVKVYPPEPDTGTGDRRSNAQQKPVASGQGGPVTRSMAQGRAPLPTEETILFPSESWSGDDEETCSEHFKGATTAQDPPERYELTDGPIRLRNSGQEANPAQEWLVEPVEDQLKALHPTVVPPSAYYLSPGWYQTGMENKKPMAPSLHLRLGLREVCAQQMMDFLESKRLYDRQIAYLTDIIHRPLGESMRAVRAAMTAIKGPTGDILEHGWTSAFPCFAVGMNRASAMHRDSKGLSAGMDIIGVLGTFTSGGQLILPDLNLEVEWTPGCLAAFDGYDLRHLVERWDGGCRVALISFCRSSTWRGLKLTDNIPRPNLSQVALISFCLSSTWRGLKLTDNIPRPNLSQVTSHLQAARKAREEALALLGIQRAKRKHQDISQEDV